MLACGGTVWKEPNHSATGGGFSDAFPLPRWQATAGVPTRTAAATHRAEVAAVPGHGDGGIEPHAHEKPKPAPDPAPTPAPAPPAPGTAALPDVAAVTDPVPGHQVLIDGPVDGHRRHQRRRSAVGRARLPRRVSHGQTRPPRQPRPVSRRETWMHAVRPARHHQRRQLHLQSGARLGSVHRPWSPRAGHRPAADRLRPSGSGRRERLADRPTPVPCPPPDQDASGHEHHQGCDSENSHVVIMRIGRRERGPSSTATFPTRR